MKTTTRIIINSLSSYAAIGASVAINIVLVPFVIRHLGKELFGLVAVAQSLCFIVALCGSGLSQAMGRYFALKHAEGDSVGFQAYYTNSVIITVGILLPFVSLIAILLASLVIPHLNVKPELITSVIHVFVFLSAYSLTQILASPYMAICATAQKFYIQHFCIVTGQSACLVFILLVLPVKPTLLVYGAAYFLSGLVSMILLFVISRRLFECCRFSSNLTDKRKILGIFSVSSQVVLPVVSNSVYTYGNQLIVNIFLGAIYNTYLEVCLIWQRFVWTVLNTVGSVIAPQITTYQTKRRWDLIAEGLCRVTKYSALIGFPLSAFLTLIPGPILWVWLKQEFNISVSIMPWFSVGLIFLICQIPAASILIALGRYNLPSVVAPILAAINLLVVLICLGLYKFGLEAIAISMFICNFIRFGLIQTLYAAKMCHCALLKYIYFGHIKPLITILPFTAVLILSKYYIASWNLTIMIVVIFICVLVYIPSCWFLGFDSWDKELTVSHLISIKNRLTKRKNMLNVVEE